MEGERKPTALIADDKPAQLKQVVVPVNENSLVPALKQMPGAR